MTARLLRALCLSAVALAAGCSSVAASAHEDAHQVAWTPGQKTGPGACRYEDKSIDKSCDSRADCMMVQAIEDCCAMTLHVGVSAKGKDQFDKKPPRDLGCQPISCNVRWMHAEDCDDESHGKIEVTCQKKKPTSKGQCMTRVGAEVTR